MFQFNQKNNNYTKPSVNTRLASFFSDTCQLTLTAWNENISIKIAPFKGVNADGIRQYAQDNSEIIATSLTPVNTIALLEGINDVIKPAIQNKTAADVSVVIGQGTNKKIIKISTDGNDTFFTIYLGVDETGKGTGDSISHKFEKKSYITNYDPTTGSGTEVYANADFENFVAKLDLWKEMNGLVPHNIAYNNAFKGNGSSFKSNNNGFGSQQNSYGGNNQYTAQSNSYTSMDEFLPLGN